jgi:hypothetical protein
MAQPVSIGTPRVPVRIDGDTMTGGSPEGAGMVMSGCE